MKSVSHNGRRSDGAPHLARQLTIYHSEATIKNVGPASFRSEHARDYACLLDVDPNVVEWRVVPPLTRGNFADLGMPRICFDTVFTVLHSGTGFVSWQRWMKWDR